MTSVRNPDWTRDETVLLMALYRSAPRAGRSHPEVRALSSVLRAAGRRDGRMVAATFRNPEGIGMRLRNFGRHDPAAPVGRDAGLKPGGSIDVAVWAEFGDDLIALEAEVARLRRSITADDWLPERRSSRGPAPSFGPREIAATDGDADVYLLHVDGPVDVLIPGLPRGVDRSVCKIGRTGSLDRRLAELASGLPPTSAIRYAPVSLRRFRSAMRAHAFERQLLDLCDAEGWSLGGEFAYAPLAKLKTAMTVNRRGK